MPCLKDPLLFFCFRVTLPLLVFAAIFLPQETAHGQTETPVGITVFFLDSELEDETAQWLQYGVPLAVALDLSQDPALDIRTVPMFPGRLRRMGFPDLVGVGYSSGRFITRGHESEWFVLGRVSSVGGTIGVDFELHPARLSIGSSSERSFTGEDALPLADEISTWIRVGIGHSPEEGGSLPDRPLSEMLTDDAHAFRLYSEGIREALVSNDEPGAISAFEGAVEVDPGFVLAQHALSEVYADLGQVEDAVAALEAAVVHLDRLPERARFRVRADHQWLVEGDPEEALRELERWADRHPRDVVAFHRKAEVLSEIGRHDDAIEALGLAFDGGSSETRALFRLGDPWLERGDTTAALKYYRTFEGLEPQWKGTLRSLAEADRAAGDLERARGRLQMLALLAPTDPQVWADLGVIVAGLGDPGAGFSLHEEGLARAETPEDRVWALENLGEWSISYRRSAEGLAYLNQAFEESEENSTEVELAQKKLNFVRTLSGGGLEEEARRIIQEARRRYPDELEEALAVAVLDLFLEYGPADSLEAAYRAYKKFFPTSEVYGESPNDHFYLARIHEERGEWREAIDRWLVRKESGSTDKSFGMSIGPCYRELGEYDRAIEYIHESLVYYPNGPRTNLQMALTYEAMGRNEEARAHLKKTLIWYADAGPQHPRARLARELAERIGLEY